MLVDYFTSIKKCVVNKECQFCKPLGLPMNIFEKLNVYIDPVKKKKKQFLRTINIFVICMKNHIFASTQEFFPFNL